jgi:hypothetical protein
MSDGEVLVRLRAAQEAATGLASNTCYVQAMDLRWVLDRLAALGVGAEREATRMPQAAGKRQWVTPTLLHVRTTRNYTLYLEKMISGHWMYLITRGEKQVGCGMAMIDPAECERLGLIAFDGLVN